MLVRNAFLRSRGHVPGGFRQLDLNQQLPDAALTAVASVLVRMGAVQQVPDAALLASVSVGAGVRHLSSTQSVPQPAFSASVTTISAPTSIPGTITQLGATTILDHMAQVRSNMGPITGESPASVVDTRMGAQRNSILDFCGAVVRGNGRYYSCIIGAGHSATADDGGYEYDLQTEAWVWQPGPRVWPTQYGTPSQGANAFGEYANTPTGFGRPCAQHTNSHMVAVGDDVIQAHGYSLTTISGASNQAHRWRAATGAWERYGNNPDSNTFPGGTAFCFYDAGRGLIWKFASYQGNQRQVLTIPANNAGASWTALSLGVTTTTDASLYRGMGYHPDLDCFVVFDPNSWSPTTRLQVCRASDIPGGFINVATTSVNGAAMPAGSSWLWAEYIPPLGIFAIPSPSEPNKVYYLTPPTDGTVTGTWTWSSETFTGPYVAWGYGDSGGGSVGPNNRLRFSDLRRGLVCIKGPGALPELFVPRALSDYYDWVDRKAQSNVVAAYSFGENPAVGGTWQWGGIGASPKATVYAMNPNYDAFRVLDRAVTAPGSKASLRFDVPAGTGERADAWRISLDNYADQFGEGQEFWFVFRCRMNSTYATYPFRDANLTSLTGFKLAMSDAGMQYPYAAEGVPTAYYGWTADAANTRASVGQNNQLQYARVDYNDEIVVRDRTAVANASHADNFKTPWMYVSKYFDFTTQWNGGNDNTTQNGGAESSPWLGATGWFYQDAGGDEYRDAANAVKFPTDTWFNFAIHIVLGTYGTDPVGGSLASNPRTGYLNSIVEMHIALPGQNGWRLLHRRTGVALHQAGDTTAGAQGVQKYGQFCVTTFMTHKDSTENHPTGKVWYDHVLVKGGAARPWLPNGRMTSYSTSFSLNEYPISESSAWYHDPTNTWQRIQTTGGNAIAGAYTDNLDDAYAYLADWYGNGTDNYEVTGTVLFNGLNAGEFELLLRVSDGPNWVKAYEILYNTAGGGIDIVRWNGLRNDYVTIASRAIGGSGYGNGNQIRARIVGNTINVWWRQNSSSSWILVHDNFVDNGNTGGIITSGKPGLAFYVHAASGNRLYVGCQDYSVIAL